MMDIIRDYYIYKNPPIDIPNVAVVYHTGGDDLEELYRTLTSSTDTIKTLIIVSSSSSPLHGDNILKDYPDIDTIVIKNQETAVSPRGTTRSYILGGGALKNVKTLVIMGYPIQSTSPFEYIREIPSLERCLFDNTDLYQKEYHQEYSITFEDDFERTTLFNQNLREITFKLKPQSEILHKMPDGWSLRLFENDWIRYRDIVPEMKKQICTSFPRIKFDQNDLDFAFRVLAKKHRGHSVRSIKHLPVTSLIPPLEWFEIVFDDGFMEERVSFKILE
jgi:hypothetical protein